MRMNMEVTLLPGERIDDLQRGGLKIIQSQNEFRFGTDAVILADYSAGRVGNKVVDIGTGTGVLPLLITARNPNTSFDAVEVSPKMADMARRSVLLNGLQDRIRVHTIDCRQAYTVLGNEQADSVVTNPPYHPEGTGLTSPEKGIALARGGDHACPVEDWVQASSRVLKYGGHVFFIYPAARMFALTNAMQKNRIEPKRIRLIAARTDDPPKLVIVEGIKGAHSGVQFLPVLFTHTADGQYSDEMLRIYGSEEKTESLEGEHIENRKDGV